MAWVLLEVTVESFLSNSLAEVPFLGGLTPALLAGGLVAVSQRPVTGLVAKRFQPAGPRLGDIVERLSDELEDVHGSGALIAAELVTRLSGMAEPSQCDLFLAHGSASTWRCWSADRGTAGSVILASALGALEETRQAIVTIDDGPVLLTKLNRTGPPQGVLTMGMRPGDHFYSIEDRQMIALFLGSLAPRLADGPGAPRLAVPRS